MTSLCPVVMMLSLIPRKLDTDILKEDDERAGLCVTHRDDKTWCLTCELCEAA